VVRKAACTPAGRTSNQPAVIAPASDAIEGTAAVCRKPFALPCTGSRFSGFAGFVMTRRDRSERPPALVGGRAFGVPSRVQGPVVTPRSARRIPAIPAAVIALSALSGPADAQEPRRALTDAISITEGASCLTHDAVTANVQGWLGSATVPGELSVLVELAGVDDRGDVAFVVLRAQDPIARRSFSAMPVTCADRRAVLGLAIAIAIDATLLHIEGALRGLALYTAEHRTPGREIIGVLMTDGDPNGCEENIDALRTIIADHLAATGIRTFIIGMEGASEDNLEELALAGGAEPHSDWCGGIGPPCHYWNVGDGSGGAIASALQDILRMSAPLPCELDVVDLTPPPGEELDFSRVNVTLTQGGTTTTIGQVPGEADCPTDRPAWYYDDPSAPTQIHLCPNACSLVSEAGDGARIDVVVGCQDTVTLI